MSQAKSSFLEELLRINAIERLSPSRLYSYSVKILPGAITTAITTPMSKMGMKSMGIKSIAAAAIIPLITIEKTEGSKDLNVKLFLTIQDFILSTFLTEKSELLNQCHQVKEIPNWDSPSLVLSGDDKPKRDCPNWYEQVRH